MQAHPRARWAIARGVRLFERGVSRSCRGVASPRKHLAGRLDSLFGRAGLTLKQFAEHKFEKDSAGGQGRRHGQPRGRHRMRLSCRKRSQRRRQKNKQRQRLRQRRLPRCTEKNGSCRLGTTGPGISAAASLARTFTRWRARRTVLRCRFIGPARISACQETTSRGSKRNQDTLKKAVLRADGGFGEEGVGAQHSPCHDPGLDVAFPGRALQVSRMDPGYIPDRSRIGGPGFLPRRQCGCLISVFVNAFAT